MTEIDVQMKRCTKCGKQKPATVEYFCRHKDHVNGLNSWCKVCERKRCQHYREDHLEEARRRSRQYRVEHPEKKAEENRRYRAKYLNEAREKAKKIRAAHPEKTREKGRKRRSRELNLPFDFISTDEIRALEYFHGLCAVCGRPLRDLFGERRPSLDHWIALSDPRPENPGTVPTNMIPLCHGIGGCNNKKNNCDPIEWLMATYGPIKAEQIIRRVEAYFDWIRRSDAEGENAV